MKSPHRFLSYGLLTILTLFFCGCSLGFQSADRSVTSGKIQEIDPSIANLSLIKKTIPRARYLAALSKTNVGSELRFIEMLYRRQHRKPYPEYRMFGVREGTVYDLLGLENADVLVAANGFTLPQPLKFPAFVQLLKDADRGTITVRRNGKPMRFEYIFTN